MIIKIDKLKVLTAIDAKTEDTVKKDVEHQEQMASIYKASKDPSNMGLVAGIWGGYGSSYVSMIHKLRSLRSACKLTDEDTVLVTDEDISLLGLGKESDNVG